MAQRDTAGGNGRVADVSRAEAEAGDTRFRHLLENLQAMAMDTDGSGKVRFVTSTVRDILGYEPAAFVGMDALAWVHQDDREEVRDLLQQLRETGEPCKSVYRAHHADGSWIWLETSSAMAHREPDGSLHLVTFSRDVTDVRQSEAALRDSGERFRAMAENASDLVTEIDGEGRFLFVSGRFTDLFGRRPEELLGRTLQDSGLAREIHPDDRERVLGRLQRLLASKGTGQLEFRVRHTDGRWRWIESTTRTYQRSDGSLRAVVISRDASGRVEAQHKLFQSEERYRILAETTGDLISETDEEGNLVYASSNIRDIVGYGHDEIARLTPFDLVHPEDMDRLRQSLENGELGQPLKAGPFRVRDKDGSWRWMEGTGVNYVRADGKDRFLFVSRDVSERIEAEAERLELEHRMQQAQKLEGLGIMAGGIAHDFNNLLTPILGDASLALLDLPRDSPVRARLVKIQKAAHRAAGLTNQMLAYAGSGPVLKEPVDLSLLVREISQLMESATSQEARITTDLPKDLPRVDADTAQLSQVVMNLITNAAEAVDAGGSISVRTGPVHTRELPTARLVLGETLRAGECVYLEVSDDGCGMDEETRERIFDPFFTTKFTGRGLGLAAVVGIVRGHGGAIDIESEPGVGTRFRVIFPAAAGATDTLDAARRQAPGWTSSGTILVVDDEASVRELVEDTLSRAGLDVLSAADGGEGVELFAKHADRIAAVLLDCAMPVTSGDEAFERILRIRPDAKIVLVSGYSEQQTRERFPREQLAGYLRKPFLPEILVAEVRAAIESRSD